MAIPPLPPGVADTPATRSANHLHSAAIHLLRRLRTVDQESGLSPERLSVLSIVTYAGPRTVSEVADLEQVSVPAVSRTVKGLEQDGLVRRERRKDDRRFVRVLATPKGRRLMERARARRLARLVEMLDGLDSDELVVLRSAAELLESI